MKSKHIFWLSSYPRSGSTWLRLMIDHYYKGEVYLDKGCQVTTGDNSHEVYENLSPYHLDGSNADQYAVIRPNAISHMSCSFQMNREIPTRDVCLKTHYANVPLCGVSPFPDYGCAGALMIVRDPRDVVISFAKYMGESLDWGVDALRDDELFLADVNKPPTMICSWNTWHKSWHIEKRFPVHAVRYEDLLNAPDVYLASVLQILGEEEIDFERVDKAVAGCQIGNLKKQEDDKGFISHLGKDRFFRKGVSGVWKDTLTPEQSGKIEDACSEMMGVFGYV